ncbi:hypothetical protein APHMUC_1508 [Anaplasma phagocytophilum str. ApMUC09]|uniref:Uncharacterized protein n=1 Tax=Anaplasma phagocytophilum str. ApMUC09 TaxID=1359152 RepID=A0A0F3NB08_ANAPH|nr:hypothetical protein APHMUC_1508 [Anaplasma phagocytophilum str. ApMUC09]
MPAPPCSAVRALSHDRCNATTVHIVAPACSAKSCASDFATQEYTYQTYDPVFNRKYSSQRYKASFMSLLQM